MRFSPLSARGGDEAHRLRWRRRCGFGIFRLRGELASMAWEKSAARAGFCALRAMAEQGSQRHISSAAADVEDGCLRLRKNVAKTARGAGPPEAVNVAGEHMVEQVVSRGNAVRHLLTLRRLCSSEAPVSLLLRLHSPGCLAQCHSSAEVNSHLSRFRQRLRTMPQVTATKRPGSGLVFLSRPASVEQIRNGRRERGSGP